MPLMTPGTVYKTFASEMQRIGGDATPGSIVIFNGTVDVYFSNKDGDTPPVDETEMKRDENGPFTGPWEVVPAARWILAKTITGAPFIETFRVIA